MIIGIGTDIVQVNRIRPSVIPKVLSIEEKERMDSFLSDLRKAEFLAGRFAAKEAIKKALPQYEKFSNLNELVILNDNEGMPYLAKPVFEDKKIWISISHERKYATAVCVIEKIEK